MLERDQSPTAGIEPVSRNRALTTARMSRSRRAPRTPREVGAERARGPSRSRTEASNGCRTSYPNQPFERDRLGRGNAILGSLNDRWTESDPPRRNCFLERASRRRLSGVIASSFGLDIEHTSWFIRGLYQETAQPCELLAFERRLRFSVKALMPSPHPRDEHNARSPRARGPDRGPSARHIRESPQALAWPMATLGPSPSLVGYSMAAARHAAASG